MDFPLWAAALLLGLASGGHCVGMCGGIVSGLALAPGASQRPYAFTAAYHLGRALSYATAGAIAGAFGQASLALRGTLAVHQALFAAASLAMLGAGLYVAGYAPFVRRIEAAGGMLWRHLAPWSRPLLPATTPWKAGLLGMLWGWLPCGMVYGALLLALGSGSIAGGATAMAAFALGTMPSLLVVGLAARSAARFRHARALRLTAGLVLAAVGAYGLLKLGLHFAAFTGLCEVPPALLP
ncbi:MAG TPA: sulfite exporter TauE/SafE family protein [Burkholderiales bacterium]